MENRYDVIIVGARVAGSSLANWLGRMGKRVLLLDKAGFPSDTLSTHFMSHTKFLEELGVLSQLEDTGLRKIQRMRTYIGESFIEGPRASYTIIPKRDQLDYALLEEARKYPSVTFKSQTTARELLWEGNQVIGLRIEEKGRSYHVYSDLVVGADGKNSNIAHWVQAETYNQTNPLRPVLYGYYKGVRPLQTPTTEIFLHDGRIGFVFPMEEGRDCLGIEIHPDEFKEMMKSPKENFELMFHQFYGMKERMEQAHLESKIIGTPGMPNFFRKAFGNGWALVGDAGHSKDPSTGLGINDAFMQSYLLADAIKEIDEGMTWSEAMQEFEDKRDQQLLPGFQLTLDYIHSLKKWTVNEVALFQSIAANPMVWNKLVPHLGMHLEESTSEFPLFYTAVEMEAETFGYKKD
ncbi:NAD(P)/FAD-dependent oxidoreductase [Halobacillus litoralis]|uniref:NAD(P)/FAD-dependent oxidoreductase n=1 Tax=Halobacillus litoralis TaxID=45668 RepID=UPI001CFE2D46|nr:NAD(P)/FAD-dependent oxidoreductase [Halobacillus litoralis]